MDEKICIDCGLTKAVDNFYLSGTGKPVSRCKPCLKKFRKDRAGTKSVAWKLCSGCNKTLQPEAFYPSSSTVTGLTPKCKECHSALAKTRYDERGGAERRREIYADYKVQALAGYGGACTCCGESDHRFLTIDHVNNDGAEHRRQSDSHAGSGRYRWVVNNKFPDGLTVLCFNCNCGRQVNGGVCPHTDPLDQQEICVLS